MHRFDIDDRLMVIHFLEGACVVDVNDILYLRERILLLDLLGKPINICKEYHIKPFTY